MKTKEDEYKIAIKMLIDESENLIRKVNNDDYISSTDIEQAIKYGKSILNDSTEQVEHELNYTDSELSMYEIDEDDSIDYKKLTLQKSKEPKAQVSLFGDEFNSCPADEPEPKPKSKTESKVDVDLSKDMPFDLPEVNELNEDLQDDVNNGLLDEQTATKVVELVNNENKYYRYESGTIYVLKPEEMNVTETAPTFFANFLSQNYAQNINEINVLDMNLDYKNHIFRSLVWTNKYGVRFQLDLKKYIEFLDNYVL